MRVTGTVQTGDTRVLLDSRDFHSVQYRYIGFVLYTVQSNSDISLDIETDTPGTGASVGRGGMPAAFDGNWHLVAVTVNRDVVPAVLKLYVDGVERSSNPAPQLGSSDIDTGRYPLRIGVFGCTGDECQNTDPFPGQIDEVEIFNRVLTPTEVAAIYAAGQEGKCRRRDHLECFNVNAKEFRMRGLLNIESGRFGLQQRCKIAGVRRLCTPAVKLVNTSKLEVNGLPWTPQPIHGQELVDDYLCYSVSCRSLRETVELHDQFAAHSVSVRRARELCTPARVACARSEAPQCGGACPPAAALCRSSASVGCTNGAPDGVLQASYEQCDDGNADNGDGCCNDCRLPPCVDECRCVACYCCTATSCTLNACSPELGGTDCNAGEFCSCS
jgi:hypothetical protein